MPKISRTTNPTKLNELDTKFFSVRIQDRPDAKRAFWLERFDFLGAGLSPGLRLACVAHAGSTEEYFELGTVDAYDTNTHLINELAPDRPLKFRFVVYEKGNPLLKAFADNIRAIDEAGSLSDSLVDIETSDLHGPAWRLEIPPVQQGFEKPVLLVERLLFPTPSAAAKDRWIAVLVMPEVMRQIATVIANNIGALEDSEVWVSAWSEYLKNFRVDELSEDADDRAISNWVDEVVAEFCGKPAMKSQFGFAISELLGD